MNGPESSSLFDQAISSTVQFHGTLEAHPMSALRYRSLSNQELDVIDAGCTELEESWRQGSPRPIEEFCHQVEPSLRSMFLVELIAVEVEIRWYRGESPHADEYLSRFPSSVEEVDKAFQLAASDDAPDSPTQTERHSDWFQNQNGQSDAQNGGVAARSETTSLQSGDGQLPPQFGRYRLQWPIGSGSMGRVYLAYDQKLDRQVAIKFPDLRHVPDVRAVVVERFRREARAMGELCHPNICPVLDFGEIEGRPFLTMAFVDGQNLADVELSSEDAAQVVRTVARAIQSAHEAGIVHRDLKPSNIMIDESGEPVVMDFGLASRAADSEAGITQSNEMIGSPAYMAPEQVRTDHSRVGPRTDVYALGVILYELLTGRRPFEGRGMSVLGQISSGQKPPLPSELANVSKRLEEICLKAMAHRIDDRYQTAGELADALEQHHVPQPRASRPLRFSKSVGLLCLVSFVAAIAWFTDDDTLSRPTSIQVQQSVREGFRGSHRRELLPPQPVPTRATRGEFHDSGQKLGASNSSNVEAGDIDGDGDWDVLVANADGPSRVWLNDGLGRFTDSQELPVRKVREVGLGDIDSDGDLDAIMVSHLKSSSVTIWLNDGTGQFSMTDWNPEVDGFLGLKLADVDADADIDAIIASARGANRIYLNDGKGNLTDSLQRLGTADSRAIGFADLDNDRDGDLFVCNSSRQPNKVWLNDGAGQFADSGQSLGDSKSNGIALIDADGDGDLDAYVTNVDGPDTVWSNSGTGHFNATITYAEEHAPGGIDIADLNGDGRLDLFVTNGFRGKRQPSRVLIRNGASFGFTTNWSETAVSSDVALADFDGDGDIDAFVANADGHSNQVWLNRDLDE